MDKQRKGKVLKRIIIAVSALVILVVAAAALLLWVERDSFVWNNSPRPEVAPITVRAADMTGYGADALYLVQMIERTHPIFIIEGYLPDDYAAVRDEFLAIAQNATSRQEFVFAAYRYVMTLQDGHMTGFNLFSGHDNMTSGELDVEWIVHSGRLMLLDNGKRADIEVTAIGGVPPAQIFAVVDNYVFAENEIYRLWNHARYARYGTMIEMAGGEILSDRAILTLSENGEISTIEMDLQMPEPQPAFVSMLEIAETYEFVVRHEMLDDNIMLIDLRIFALHESIEETALYIEQAIENGIRKFIVDLRGNRGGDSRAGERLLQAMDITVPVGGSVRRYSPLMLEVFREVDIHPIFRAYVSITSLFTDGMLSTPNPDTASNPNNVFVAALTDSDTYSSATMMAYWVQDGGFGNIIGSPSRNAPSSFEDMLFFTLPYSGLQARVSHVQWLRPDTTADQSTLWPDIMVDPADALDVAIEYLRNLVQ